MEYYESTCKSCKKTYRWTGYGTGIGKTPAQLAQMKRDVRICHFCGKEGLDTTLAIEPVRDMTGREWPEHSCDNRSDMAKALVQVLYTPDRSSFRLSVSDSKYAIGASFCPFCGVSAAEK